MTTFANFRKDIRINSLVCSSIAVLLAACGGGGVDQANPAQNKAQLAGFMASSEVAPQAAPQAAAPVQDTAPAASANSPALGADQADQAALAAPASANPSSEADFVLAGYQGGPFQQDNGNQPATHLSYASSSAMQTGAAPVVSAALAPDMGANVVVPATTYKLYVSPNGNDASAGTASAPFRTLARAARSTRPSTTVFVAPGTYAGGIKTTIHGSASARIYYVSTTKWGAKIVKSGTAKNAWDNRGNYVDIIGFHVDGTGSTWTGGIYNGGSYDAIRGNWVHHIAKGTACNSAGGSAIGVDSYYRGVAGDVVGNLVHDIGPAACRYVQGIYISTTGTVKNNVVYRVAEGAIHLWHDARNVIITNNTVTTSNTGIIVGGGDYYFTSGPSNNNRVYNNIVYDNKMGISEQGRTGTANTYRNNLVFQNTTYNWKLNNGLTHSATVTSNPLFVGYTRTGTPDLRLSSSSPAIGRGTATDALAYDYLERPRNTSTGFDIGAYQH